LEQNAINPIRLRIAPNVPIAGCLPRPGSFFQKAKFGRPGIFPKSFFQNGIFGFAGGGVFPKGGWPHALQNLLSAVFSDPQWLQYGMDAKPSKTIFTPDKIRRAEVL